MSTYERNRTHKDSYQFPALFEIGIALALAERFRAAGDVNEAKRLIVRAVEDHPGTAGLSELEEAFTGKEALDWRAVLLLTSNGAVAATEDTEIP